MNQGANTHPTLRALARVKRREWTTGPSVTHRPESELTEVSRVVAHDLGNALTGIIGYCHLLDEELDPASLASAFVREIQDVSERATELMERIRRLGELPTEGEARDRGDHLRPGRASRVDVPDVGTTSLRADHASAPPTVLVVEDDSLVRRVACLLLMDAGYEVIEAENPTAALTLPQETLDGVSLVLTDVTMPGMSGPEMIEHLTAAYPSLPAVFMSGLPRDHLVDAGHVPANATVLEKPFTERELTAAIEASLPA